MIVSQKVSDAIDSVLSIRKKKKKQVKLCTYIELKPKQREFLQWQLDEMYVDDSIKGYDQTNILQKILNDNKYNENYIALKDIFKI